jgi:hypothetical protein
VNYTAIIPTMWKSERMNRLLHDLIECHLATQIIVIDNRHLFYEKYTGKMSDKLVIYQPPQGNLFIAGSWNTGVKLATNEYLAICNDDVNFNPYIVEELSQVDGIIGQASSNYTLRKQTSELIAQPYRHPRPYGWASLFFLQKKHWIDVPEELRIWFNDDFILHFNPAPKWTLHNFMVETEMSTTIDSGEFETNKIEDQITWQRIIRERMGQ